MCKMSLEREFLVWVEKNYVRGMVFGDIVIVPFAVYIYLFPAVKIFEDLEDKGYILKKNEKQNLKNLF